MESWEDLHNLNFQLTAMGQRATGTMETTLKKEKQKGEV